VNWVVKFFLAGGLITGANALMRLSPKLSASLIALPTSSIIYFIFLWTDTKDPQVISRASWDIFKIVVPSLVFFPLLSIFLTRFNLSFFPSLLLSVVACSALYYLQMKLGLG
jgi:hypothetical protein